jgi:hypothetical protein
MQNLIRKEDGYINMTELAKSANKRIDNWTRTKQFQDFLRELELEINLPKNKLIITSYGKSGNTYYHPILATYVAQFLSTKFALKVSIWIDEWKKEKNNQEIYNKELEHLQYNNYLNKEKDIKIKLHKELGGEIEVETEVGYIDLLTDTEIIEIKHGLNWKHAVGQILIYSLVYPKHKKRIHLFDIKKTYVIELYCKTYNIEVTYDENL